MAQAMTVQQTTKKKQLKDVCLTQPVAYRPIYHGMMCIPSDRDGADPSATK